MLSQPRPYWKISTVCNLRSLMSWSSSCKCTNKQQFSKASHMHVIGLNNLSISFRSRRQGILCSQLGNKLDEKTASGAPATKWQRKRFRKRLRLLDFCVRWMTEGLWAKGILALSNTTLQERMAKWCGVSKGERLGLSFGVIEWTTPNWRNPNALVFDHIASEWILHLKEQARAAAWLLHKRFYKVQGRRTETWGTRSSNQKMVFTLALLW